MPVWGTGAISVPVVGNACDQFRGFMKFVPLVLVVCCSSTIVGYPRNFLGGGEGYLYDSVDRRVTVGTSRYKQNPHFFDFGPFQDGGMTHQRMPLLESRRLPRSPTTQDLRSRELWITCPFQPGLSLVGRGGYCLIYFVEVQILSTDLLLGVRSLLSAVETV